MGEKKEDTREEKRTVTGGEVSRQTGALQPMPWGSQAVRGRLQGRGWRGRKACLVRESGSLENGLLAGQRGQSISQSSSAAGGRGTVADEQDVDEHTPCFNSAIPMLSTSMSKRYRAFCNAF